MAAGHTIDAIWARNAVARLQEAKQPIADILSAIGIDPLVLKQRGSRIAFRQHATLLDRAAELTGDDCFALNLAARPMDLREVGLLTYVGLSSKTLGEAIRNLARFVAILNEAVRVELQLEGDRAVVALDVIDATVRTRQQAMEFAVANLVRALRAGGRRDLRLVEVAFLHPRSREIDAFERFFGCPVLPVHPDLKIHRDDVLTLVGAKKDVEKATTLLGYADRATSASDMFFMGVGIVIGALLGAITVHIGGIPLSFSSSVGALVAGLVCGYLRSVHRTLGRIPAPALWVFNNVGLNGFIAVVGINAGPGLLSGLQAYGLELFLAGIVVSMVPLIVGIYAGKYIFKFHPGILLGACAGARTSTAALGALQHEARSSVPVLGYTVTYAVGRIVLAVWGVVIVLLMN